MGVRIAIIGTGYVGLVTGTCFAEVGHSVVCVDCDADKIHALQQGEIPIYEPGLEELVTKNVNAGRLRFTVSTEEGVKNSDVVFIAVPTPPLPDGGVDLSFIERVARDIADGLNHYTIVVDKSTVPVKTGEKVAETIRRYAGDKAVFDVVSNPEFLREGFAVHDLMNPDRVVIGTTSDRPVETMKAIYEPFNAPTIVTDINSAELIKHAANSFLALKISYINAVSVICEVSGANVDEVARGIGMDDRIGNRFLNASLGFGGSCFPKDLSAFIRIAEELGYDFELLKAVQQINANQMERFVKKIIETLWVLKDKKLGVLGLAFKENVPDLRNTRVIDVIRELEQYNVEVSVHDPLVAPAEAMAEYSIDTIAEPDIRSYDAIIIAVAHREFLDLGVAGIRGMGKAECVLFDLKGILGQDSDHLRL